MSEKKKFSLVGRGSYVLPDLLFSGSRPDTRNEGYSFVSFAGRGFSISVKCADGILVGIPKNVPVQILVTGTPFVSNRALHTEKGDFVQSNLTFGDAELVDYVEDER